MPAHLFPAVIDDDVGTVAMVDGMQAHPVRERDMVRYEIGSVATERETLGLTLGRSIQKADVDTREGSSARGCVEFAGRDRISTEDEMLSGFLVFESQLDGSFNSHVPPPKAPLGRDTQSAQLAGGDSFGDLCFNQLADAGFPDAARACDKKEHPDGSLGEGLGGGNKEMPYGYRKSVTVRKWC